MVSIREFRLPSFEGRQKMTVEELIDTRDQYYSWICMNEERMTFEGYDRLMDKLAAFEDYIEKRIAEGGAK